MKIYMVGKTIKEVRPMGEREMETEGWEGLRPGVCIVFTDGTRLIPSQDDEGNGPGAFFFYDTEDNSFLLKS